MSGPSSDPSPWSAWVDLWPLIALPVLLVLVIVTLAALFREVGRGDPARVRRRAWLFAASLLATPVLLALSNLSWFLDLARLGPALRAQAWAHGAPHVASVQASNDILGVSGYLYDDGGEATKPCATQTQAWRQAAERAHVNTCDLSVSPVAGSFYRWDRPSI